MTFCILLSLQLIVTAFTVRRMLLSQLHMLQLNTYKNKEHLAWMKKNPGKFLPDCLIAVWSLLFIFFGSGALYVFLILFSLLLLPVNKRETNAKKPLAWTNRVKRLTVVVFLLIAVTLLPAVYIKQEKHVFLLIGLFEALFPLYIPLANLIARPLEKYINHWYISDAKKKLSSCPELQTIGITGSFGKTSVKFYLYTLMSAFYDVLVTPESYNTPMGVVKTVRGSLEPSDKFFLCEMGARHVGDIKELCDIVHPRHGIITAIGEQHLETFHTVENIIHTKYELADALPADGLLFLNGDSKNICDNLPHRQYITYGITSANDYYASDITVGAAGTSFILHNAKTGETEEYHTRLIGDNNVLNIVGALAVANTFGIALPALRVPVRRIQPVPHRMQLLNKGDITFIDDAYNSNPAGCRAALKSLSLCDGLRIIVTPGMVELGEKQDSLNREFGAEAAQVCDYVILVGEKQTAAIAEGVRSGGFNEHSLFIASSLAEAMDFVRAIKTDKMKFVLLENDLPDNY